MLLQDLQDLLLVVCIKTVEENVYRETCLHFTPHNQKHVKISYPLKSRDILFPCIWNPFKPNNCLTQQNIQSKSG